MSTIALVVSADGETTMSTAGSRLVEVDCEQYTNDPAKAISDAEPILTLPPDDQLERLAGSLRNPPAGTADPRELALARMLVDVVFGSGGLDDRYRLVPVVRDGEDSEKLLERPELPPLSAGIFSRYRDGSTSDLINQINEVSPATLLLAIVAAFKRVGEGIYDGAKTAENRAIGIDVALTLAD
jgi:hypothetical protein